MLNGHSRSSQSRKDRRKGKDYTCNYVDRVRLGQSSLQSSRQYQLPRGSGWRQKSISNLDLSASRHSSAPYFEDDRQLRPSRSLDYKRPSHKDDALDIAEFYWRIDPDRDYEKLPHNYIDENGYHSTNLYNHPFDIGNESCSLRRSRSLAVIREETFSDLQISTTNNSGDGAGGSGSSHRRSQLIPRARLVNRGFFKERFTGSKQPTYYHHHHLPHPHHHQSPTAEQPPSPDAVAQPPDTTTITRESDEYYDNLKRLDAHQQAIWQNEKSDLESLNSEYFRNSHHQTEPTSGEKQRLYQSTRQRKSTVHRKYSAQPGEESCPELSQSSVFPETTTTSNSDDQSDSLINSEQEYDIEKVEEILSKVYGEKFEIISLIGERDNQERDESSEDQGTLIAYDSVYLSSEDSSEGTVVEEKPESTSLLHISIEDIYDPPRKPVEKPPKEQVKKPLHSQVLRVPPVTQPSSTVDTKPKILAVVEKKKLRRLSDYAAVTNQRRGVLEHLTYISTQYTHHHHTQQQPIDNQYHSLPDVNISKSLKASERIDAKLRSSYHPKEDDQTTTVIYDSIKRFGRAHKKARQREQDTKEPTTNSREDEVEKPKEAPSIQVETFSKEITNSKPSEHREQPKNTEKSPAAEAAQFRIIVTDAQNNVIEEDSIDGHSPSLIPETEEKPVQDQEKPNTTPTTLRRPISRNNSKSKRITGTITAKSPSEVYKTKDKRVACNTYRARPVKLKPNDSLRRVGKMSRPQVIQVVDSKRGSIDRKHPIVGKAVEDEFLQKVDAIRCYWSKFNQDKENGENPIQDKQNENQNQNKANSTPPRKDFILGGETKSLNVSRTQQTTNFDDLQSLMPSIEIVELDGDKQATIVKANPDEPVPEFDHIRYKVMKPNLFRNNILNRNKKEPQFDGLIQYLQEYSFQELLTNNNVVIVEPVRTKVERPPKAQNTKSPAPGPGQNCKITNGNGNTTNSPPSNQPDATNTNSKLGKRHFFYQPVRVNRELLEEELPTPDTVRNVRKFFEEHVLPNKHRINGPSDGNRKTITTPPPSPEVPNGNAQQTGTGGEGRRSQRSRLRYLTIDTSYGNSHAGNGATLRKWDSVSLSSGISSGDLSSPCECTTNTVDERSHADAEGENERKQNGEVEEIRGGIHVRDFIRKHNACGLQDSNGMYGDYVDSGAGAGDGGNEGEDEEEEDEDDFADDELCESYYVSEDVLEKIRECGSTVTYYGGRVTMHSPPATGATLRIPRSKIEFLTCSTCQPNQCPHKDQLHDQLGIKFKLIKSNSCSSRLELIGTQKHNNHHPTTIGEDESMESTTQHSNNDDDDYDDGEPLVRRIVHRLETTGKISGYTGPRIIESQCIEKTRRPTSLIVERQKFETPEARKRLSEGFTINNQMVGGNRVALGGADDVIPDQLAFVQLLKQVTVNNHITIPVPVVSEAQSFTSSAMDIRLIGQSVPENGTTNPDGNLTNEKVCRNKNVDLAFAMKGPNGTIKKSMEPPAKVPATVNGIEKEETNRPTQIPKDSSKTIVPLDSHLAKDESITINMMNVNKPPPPQPPPANVVVTVPVATDPPPTGDNTLVRHYVTNDKRLFEKRKYDDIEFEEFEVYDPAKEAVDAKPEPSVDEAATRTVSSQSDSSTTELKSTPDTECYDSLDDKI